MWISVPVPSVGVSAMRGVAAGCSVGDCGLPDWACLDELCRMLSWLRGCRTDCAVAEAAGLSGDWDCRMLCPLTTDPKPSSLLRRADACAHGRCFIHCGKWRCVALARMRIGQGRQAVSKHRHQQYKSLGNICCSQPMLDRH